MPAVQRLGTGRSASFADVQLTPFSYSAENKDVVTIKAGQPVAIHSSGVGIIRADATAPGKESIGIAMVDIAVGFAGAILVDGPMMLADWTDATGAVTLDPRAIYFLETTPGKLTTTPPAVPGNVLQRCGLELATNILSIKMDLPINL